MAVPMWMPPLKKGGPSWEIEEGLCPRVLLQQLVVHVLLLPALEHPPPAWAGRPHGEVGLGQIDELVVVRVSLFHSILFAEFLLILGNDGFTARQR